jgi:hypothetical protein
VVEPEASLPWRRWRPGRSAVLLSRRSRVRVKTDAAPCRITQAASSGAIKSKGGERFMRFSRCGLYYSGLAYVRSGL